MKQVPGALLKHDSFPLWKSHVTHSLVSDVDSSDGRKIHKCLLNLCCHSHHQLSHPNAKLLTNSHSVPEEFSQLLSEKGSFTRLVFAGKVSALATINKKCLQPAVGVSIVSCPNCMGIKSFFHWDMRPHSRPPPTIDLSQDSPNLPNDQNRQLGMTSQVTVSQQVIQARYQLCVQGAGWMPSHGTTSLGSSTALGCYTGRQPHSRTPGAHTLPQLPPCHIFFLAPRLCCTAGGCEMGQVTHHLIETQQVYASAMVNCSKGDVKLHSSFRAATILFSPYK